MCFHVICTNVLMDFFSVILYVFIREPSRTDSSFMSKHSWHLYIDLGDMILDNTLGIM